MIIKAYAKINLSLDIVGKREDGYHLLEMIMQTLELHDEVILTERPSGISLTCDKHYVPVDERNIAFKAAKLIMERKGLKAGVHIHIQKNIPVAAGLAGGSTDAAAVLKGMNQMFSMGLSNEELMELGLMLGADVPYCINGGTALCEGVGEKITMLDSFKGQTVVLVKPPFGVSTKDAYGMFNLEKIKRHVETKKLIEALANKDLNRVHYYSRNLLENVIIQSYPVIKSIKHRLMRTGAQVTLMSGSGPTVYGIYKNRELALSALDELKKNGNEVILTVTR